MCRWLDEQIGRSGWWHVEERLPTLPDTMLFHFDAHGRREGFHRPLLSLDDYKLNISVSLPQPHITGPCSATSRRRTNRSCSERDFAACAVGIEPILTQFVEIAVHHLDGP